MKKNLKKEEKNYFLKSARSPILKIFVVNGVIFFYFFTLTVCPVNLIRFLDHSRSLCALQNRGIEMSKASKMVKQDAIQS